MKCQNWILVARPSWAFIQRHSSKQYEDSWSPQTQKRLEILPHWNWWKLSTSDQWKYHDGDLDWIVLQACKQYDSSSGRKSTVCRGILVQDGSSSCDSLCEIHSQVGNHKGCSLKRPPVGLWAEEIADSESWGGNSTLTRRGQDRFRFTQADNKAVWSTIGWPGGWTRDSCDQDNLKLSAILWIFPLSEMDWAAFLISWWPWFLFQYFQCEAKNGEPPQTKKSLSKMAIFASRMTLIWPLSGGKSNIVQK